MPIISLLKRKAKKYLEESIDYIQDGLDTSKDYPEASNTFRVNSSPGRNLEVFVHPNIPRSFSAIDISRGTQTNFVQIPKIILNHQRINPCMVTNQCRGTNSFPYAQNTNFILINPIVRPSNFNQTPRISPSNVSQRLVGNDEILACRLQQEFDNENRSRVRQSSNNILNNPIRPTVNITNYQLANRQTHRPYRESQTNRNIIMNQNQVKLFLFYA
ncbi:hypothetical protein BpHYR1_037921 [Brachionus plicatilis]|uniref:Uncharacterized protein n=1 Tax=Brachionus plicatilis TaxID=10195 RepID=A0A3M7QDG5_BRAPC|nr:hypothetical protein BpHYR1_037921 [Brachionus plicatilis]